MWKFPKSHSQDIFFRVGVVVIQGTKPAQVIVQVVGGNAVKATDPLLEAPVIGVDVLNMNCAFDTLACAQVDGRRE